MLHSEPYIVPVWRRGGGVCGSEVGGGAPNNSLCCHGSLCLSCVCFGEIKSLLWPGTGSLGPTAQMNEQEPKQAR